MASGPSRGAEAAATPRVEAAGGDKGDVPEVEEQKPLLDEGSSPSYVRPKRINWGKRGLFASYCLAPFSVLALIVFVWCFVARGFTVSLAVAVAAALCICCLMWTTLTNSKEDEYNQRWRAVTVVALMMLAYGMVSGYVLRRLYFDAYHAFDENQLYSNLLAEEPARAHSDAGILRFAIGTQVDIASGAGYVEGHQYCVAPVVNDANNLPKVEYWAVGTDCCAEPRGFHCDDSLVSTALAGVVVRPKPNTLLWRLLGVDPWRMYEKARKVAQTRYNLVSADQALFVRWVTHPGVIHTELLAHGLGGMMVVLGFGLVVCFFAGAIIMKIGDW
mmetsp:Transcript_34571/g.75718  ORF Transcript_34571/g.75718 Transcript_34571/m.75718 type:complete len:331 (-) Transcript_34571:79-1071(-)